MEIHTNENPHKWIPHIETHTIENPRISTHGDFLVASLIKENVVIEKLDEKLYLNSGVHALVGDLQPLLQTVNDFLAVTSFLPYTKIHKCTNQCQAISKAFQCM